jgi:DNA mismatch repair protein MutH
VGQLLERCLGVTAASRQGPDFPDLGVELKTLPVDRAGKPLESTYVTRVPAADLHGITWETSPVRAKLARVLFVPVLATRAVPLAERVVGRAILWSPSPAEEAILRADFEAHVDRLRQGLAETLTARDGEALQVRPKGANAADRVWGEGAFASVIWTRPLGFYLRARFTAGIVEAYLQGRIPEPIRPSTLPNPSNPPRP